MGTIDAGVPAYTRHLRFAAITASAAAGAVHLGAVHSHLMEYRPAAGFMLVTGIAQVVWALLVARDVSTRLVVRAGALGNAAIIALWVVSRTSGLPFGEEPWVAEHVHPTDQLATLLELLIVIVCVAHLRPAFVVRARLFAGMAAFGTFYSLVATSHEPARERLVAFATLAVTGGVIAFASAASHALVVRPMGRGNEASAALHRLDRLVVPARASARAGG